LQDAIFVQHCQSHHHVDPQARLWPDYRNGLTEFGQRQAQRVAQRLHDEVDGQPCKLYTSPMRRAAETAEIVSLELDVTPQMVHDLHENNGRFALERSESGPEWTIDRSNWSLFDWRPFPEGETWREFHTRVAAAMDWVAEQHPEGELAIFSVHGGTLSNIVVWWLGIPLEVLPERTCFSATPGSLSVLKKNRHGNPVIERLNDRAHLAGLC
jgi:2,3-bisphosphoglycerate-dependent phosphoglycerate mutase